MRILFFALSKKYIYVLPKHCQIDFSKEFKIDGRAITILLAIETVSIPTIRKTPKII